MERRPIAISHFLQTLETGFTVKGKESPVIHCSGTTHILTSELEIERKLVMPILSKGIKFTRGK